MIFDGKDTARIEECQWITVLGVEVWKGKGASRWRALGYAARRLMDQTRADSRLRASDLVMRSATPAAMASGWSSWR